MGLSSSLLPVVVASSAFLSSSLLLLRHPVLPWTLGRKKRGPPPVRAIAHRGGAGEGYENTMEAFRRAVARGAEMLELDVHLSKDNKVLVVVSVVMVVSLVMVVSVVIVVVTAPQVVVAHDKHLLRLTGEDVSIGERRLEDLPCLQEKVSSTLYLYKVSVFSCDLPSSVSSLFYLPQLQLSSVLHDMLYLQVSIDFAPGLLYTDPGLPREARRLPTLDQVHLHLPCTCKF